MRGAPNFKLLVTVLCELTDQVLGVLFGNSQTIAKWDSRRFPRFELSPTAERLLGRQAYPYLPPNWPAFGCEPKGSVMLATGSWECDSSISSIRTEMHILCTEPLAFILRALKALLEIVLIRMRLFIAIKIRGRSYPRNEAIKTADLAVPNSWVRFESDCCRIRVHISMFDAEQSQAGQ